jgi:hypothetical protein
VNDRIIRIAAARHQGHDRGADGISRGVRAGGRHVAGDFEPEDVGSAGRRGIAALALNYVRAIHARHLHADQDFALLWLGNGTLDHLQDVRPAAAFGDDCPHHVRKLPHFSLLWPTISPGYRLRWQGKHAGLS